MVDKAEEVISTANENGQKSQNQIETAVKFLQNPKVRETPLSQRKAFLIKKGLTEDEIQKAIELSQTVDSGQDILPRYATQGQPVFPGQPQPYSLKFRDFFWVALIGGGLGYLVAHLVKTYLLPYISNKKDESDEKIDQLQTSVSELKENLSQTVNGIQDTLDSVQKMLQDQQQKVQTMSLNLSTSQASLSQSITESYSLTEIKSELSSLKGLLLNRRQFPSPVVQSSPFPSIPVWQRNDTQPTDNDSEKDTDIRAESTGEITGCNGDDCSSSSGTLELPSGEDSSFLTMQESKDFEQKSSDEQQQFLTMPSEVQS